MDDQGDLLRRALDADKMSAFLVGEPPYYYHARKDFQEPQNVSEAMLLQVAPYWRLTKDERLPHAFAQGLLQLLQAYPDQNKALYVCSNWIRSYYYGLMKKREQYPLGSYADLFETDLTLVAKTLRQEVLSAKASLKLDKRWAGAEWNDSSGLWGAILSSALRTRDQFNGLDFVPTDL